MVNIKDCYFHSLNLNAEKTLEVFESILKSGRILSLEKSGIESSRFRMNKPNEICISKKERYSFFYRSAYAMYAKQKLSFILKGNLPGVYKPELIPIRDTFGDAFRYADSGMTDLCGEYRVKDEIAMAEVIGINLPVKALVDNIGCYKWFFADEENPEVIKKLDLPTRTSQTISFYKQVVDSLESNGMSLPIFDVESGCEIKSEKDIIKIKKR